MEKRQKSVKQNKDGNTVNKDNIILVTSSSRSSSASSCPPEVSIPPLIPISDGTVVTMSAAPATAHAARGTAQ